MDFRLVDTANLVLNYTLAGEHLHTTFGDLDETAHATIKLAIVHGMAIGLGVLLLFLSWVIVVKKRSPIFLLNQATLACMILKSGLYLGFLLGPMSSMAYLYTGILRHNQWSGYRVSVVLNVAQTLLVASVEATLVFQVHVVFQAPEVRTLGRILTALTGLLGLTTVGFYINNAVRSGIELREQLEFRQTHFMGTWVNNVPTILFSVSLNVVCVILVVKLAMAIRTRRYLGLKQFDAFHILVITLAQTSIVPSALVISNYRSLTSYSTLLANISYILAVCNLPFSSLWAALANNAPKPTSSHGSLFGSSEDETYPMLPTKVHKVGTPDTEKDAATYVGDTESLSRLFESLSGPETVFKPNY